MPPDLDPTFSLLALLNLHQFFMLRSLSPLRYNVGSSYILYLIHIFIMVCTCQSGICHLTLTSFSWSTDFIKFTSSFHYFLHHLQHRFTMFGPHIYHGGYLSDLHVAYLWPHFHSLPVLLNMIRSVSPLHVPYHLGSPCSSPHFHSLLTLLNLC